MALTQIMRPATGRGHARPLGDWLANTRNPLRATLDSMNANCFVADLSLNLVYLNAKAQRTAHQLAPAVRSAFGLSIDQLLGGSIHRFHHDRARIERILADPSALPREASFSFGGITLRTMINVITDSAGERHGYVVIWDNVSERNIAADTAVRRVRDATERLSAITERIAGTAASASTQADSAENATSELRQAISEIARSSAEALAQVREHRRCGDRGTVRGHLADRRVDHRHGRRGTGHRGPVLTDRHVDERRRRPDRRAAPDRGGVLTQTIVCAAGTGRRKAADQPAGEESPDESSPSPSPAGGRAGGRAGGSPPGSGL